MGALCQVALAIVLILVPLCRAGAADPKPFPGTPTRWQGFARHDFQVDGTDATVVVPDKPLPGRPRVWRGEFFGAFADADVALVKAGWHLAYLKVPDLFGSPRAMAKWETFHTALTGEYGLHPKPGADRPVAGRALLPELGGGPPRQDAGRLPGQRRLRLQELAGRQAERAGRRAGVGGRVEEAAGRLRLQDGCRGGGVQV